jgi:hypothetical protein
MLRIRSQVVDVDIFSMNGDDFFHFFLQKLHVFNSFRYQRTQKQDIIPRNVQPSVITLTTHESQRMEQFTRTIYKNIIFPYFHLLQPPLETLKHFWRFISAKTTKFNQFI